jgi:hypothetical protein
MTNKEKLSQVKTLLEPSKLNAAERSNESLALELLAEVVESIAERPAPAKAKSATKDK